MAIDVTHVDPRQADVKQGSVPPRADDRVDVSSVLDKARFGSLQLVVLALTFLTLVMDGFDIQAIAFAAPALTRPGGSSAARSGRCWLRRCSGWRSVRQGSVCSAIVMDARPRWSSVVC